MIEKSPKIPTSLQNAYNADVFRQQGHELVDMLADYLIQCNQASEMPILPWQKPNDSLKLWTDNFQKPELAQSGEIFKEILAQSTHVHHPHYAGHQVAAPLPVAVLGDMMSAFLNNGMAVYEMGPASTPIERIVCQWIAQKFGMDNQADGIMVSGGSLGNLTALLAARQTKTTTDIWKNGLRDSKQLAIMVSEEAHYCVARSAKIMGLGEEGVILIPADSERKMRTDLLPQIYEEAQQAGKHVFAIVGSACTTSTGSYDNLEAIAHFSKQHNIWFHVDGAHGVAVALSEEFKHLVVGIEQADSVIIDFHKMMMMPALTTGVIFRNAQDSYKTFAQKAAYLLEEKENNWFDLAGRTVECTKKMMALKIYLALKTHGEQVFSDFVTHTHQLAQHFAYMLKNQKNFELAQQPQSNIICFRFAPSELSEEEINRLNREIRQEIIEDGTFYIVQTILDGKVYLRTTLMNPQIDSNIFSKLLSKVEIIAKHFLAG